MKKSKAHKYCETWVHVFIVYMHIFMFSTMMFLPDDICVFKSIMHTGGLISVGSWKTYVYVLHYPLQMTCQNMFSKHSAIKNISHM